MSRPQHEDIANAIGIETRQVSQLARRGMPTATIGKANEWFEKYGMNHHTHKGRGSNYCKTKVKAP